MMEQATGGVQRLAREVYPTPLNKLLSALHQQEYGMTTGTLNGTHETTSRSVSIGSAVLDVAVDAGNSETVLVADGIELVIPSAVTLTGPSTDAFFALRRLPHNSFDQLTSDEHIVSFDGVTDTYVGNLAIALAEHGYTTTTTRGNDSRYTGYAKELFLTALAAAYPHENSLTVRVATGVPAGMWSHELKDRIVSSWKGTHTYTYNGRARAVNVRDVTVLAEGHAAWAALPVAQQQGDSVVLDIGGRTAIALWLKDGVVQQQLTDALGVEGVLDQVAGALGKAGHRPLTLSERRGLLIALKNGQPYTIVHNNKRVRVDTVAAQVFASAAARLLQQLRLNWQLAQADTLTIVGGGVYFHGPHIEKALPSFVLAKDPERLNARGYYQQLTARTATKRGRR